MLDKYFGQLVSRRQTAQTSSILSPVCAASHGNWGGARINIRKMRALHTPTPLIYTGPSFIKPHLLLFRYSAADPRFLLTPTKPHNLDNFRSFFRRRSIATTVAAMGGSKATPDHVAGDWFSVPGLRLRDHRFTVPLDYSIDHSTSPTISVFAREVVSGNFLESNILHFIF